MGEQQLREKVSTSTITPLQRREMPTFVIPLQRRESADVEKSADVDPSTVVRINGRGIINRINNDRCVT